MLVNKKAVSTIILVILILCSAVFGALLSYLWVMGNFYLEPENTVDLVITQVDFPVDHAEYFYVTVMNPSHSPSGTNITEIYFTVEGDNKLYNVTSTYPEALPITIERGTSKTIRCNKNWGEFAGKTIMVQVASTDASGAAASIKTQYVKLEVSTRFDATVSCKQFNLTINNNPQSAINLTLTKIYINMMPVENISQLPNDQNVTFPINAAIGNPISLRCWYNWETFKNPKIRVETSEGYYAETSANATASILLLITDVAFNETNPSEVSITVLNSEASSTPVDISDIVLTYRNGTQDQQYHINGTLTTPQFAPYYRLGIGNTTTFNHCIWNWRNYRDQNVTITVYTKQGYTPASKIVPHTPGEIIFHISSSFNLTDTAHFSVNVTNMQCSLQNITVTQIKLNTNLTSFTSGNVSIGEWRQFNCDFDWATFRGSTVTITVNASNTIVFQNVTLPHMLLKIVNANFTTTGNGKEFNVTIENIGNSSRNATIARIVVRFGNDTVFQSEGIGYVVEVGKNATLTFSWDWSEYETEEVTISVYTTEELEFFNAFIV